MKAINHQIRFKNGTLRLYVAVTGRADTSEQSAHNSLLLNNVWQEEYLERKQIHIAQQVPLLRVWHWARRPLWIPAADIVLSKLNYKWMEEYDPLIADL